MNKLKNIIFDFGGVLVDWNPAYLYRNEFESESEMNYFLENICTPEWNIKQDEGRTLAEATETLQKEYPEYKEMIGLFYGRWEEMLKGDIKENVSVLKKLKEKYPLYGLTNWSSELIDIAYKRFDFFKLFDGIVVSGDEKLIKPDPKLYDVLLSRFDIQANESLFIDDNEQNIVTARKMGFHTIHFIEGVDLENEIKKMGLL
ncbi:MAG: HAD family phosphatase [Dysgonamonadaceae bacterium]|nr:HAD family phosphatase [Dysgonamonadaceae bacterium]MDD4728849.1 HAD family phosphatase [Dysgonamonadaceae bacterium]